MIKIGGFGKIWRIYSPDGSSTRLGKADWKRVCLAAQKSYKSEQIEQISNDEKKVFGRFGKICIISRQSRPEESVLRTDVLMSRQASKSRKSSKSEQIGQIITNNYFLIF